MKTITNSPVTFLVAVEKYRKALAAFEAAAAIDENGDDINELDEARFHAKCMVEISHPASLGEFFQKLEFIAIESDGDIINAKIIDLVAADLCLLTGYRHIQSEAIKAQWRNGVWGPEPPTPAPYDGDLSAVIDPDAEVRRLAAAWHVAEDRAAAPPVTGDDEDTDTETWPHLEALTNARSVGLAGLAAKMKDLLRYRGDDEIGKLEGDLIRSIARDIDRLAPGSVIYHPETGEEAEDCEGRDAA